MKFDEHQAPGSPTREPSVVGKSYEECFRGLSITPGRAHARPEDELNGNMVVRARMVADRCSEYERRFGAKKHWRRSIGPPCAVVALADELGCSHELVRRLRNVGTRIPAALLDALLPHRPCLGHLADLSRLPVPHMELVVSDVTAGRKRLGKAICDEEDRLRSQRLRRAL